MAFRDSASCCGQGPGDHFLTIPGVATLRFKGLLSINVQSLKIALCLNRPTTSRLLKGRHSLKFGVLVRYYQWIGYDSSNYVGIFNFTGSETQNSAATGGDAFADFLLGYPASVARAYPANNFGGQRWYQQYFAQDDIRVNPKLTVNIGLRYEYSPWLNGYKGQLGTFDPTKTKPIIVESNTEPGRS